ncbi:DUF3052 domain-containing protein [Dermatophilus congolensis]|nr:DUF3052 domain-containing protein [Dermatophilus congolensis]MBO3142708.1 DUF3052 domain-containing protein [Dermatophilus congolensis]MBO3151700.1 DUF3052 domain-containing protein [Dermatophilus congolensis]MBO3161300.1 DUF3052 domain-containing protein [Dermatophilus congolensis]MBO3162981.1 DUF3052 domain-containing protein [Dermatophilus congolensis]MBO3176533.1 DUF3052 domain-containing protein [Dermatophilus congolensis]
MIHSRTRITRKVHRVATSAQNGHLSKLGFGNGDIVMEFGYDDDVDDNLRMEIEDLIDGDLEDEDFEEVVDAVLVWWRDGDGDLTDNLVDAVSALGPNGFIVLLSPKVGRDGEVDPVEIAEAAETAGLNASVSTNLTPQWSATRLVAPKNAAKR